MSGGRASRRARTRTKLPLTVAILGIASVAGADEFFTSNIELLLRRRCYECHSHEKKIKGGLTLDSRSGWEQGGDAGPAIVIGNPDESLLIRMVRWTDDDRQMPPKKKLAAAEIALLEEWVKRGAPDPRKMIPAKPGDDWWSLRPLPAIARHRATAEKMGGSGSTVIDGFITAKLREHGLTMSPEADRRTLIRRLAFDLHGLPPTPEEMDAFVVDRNADAYAKLVGRLLASPRYGERFARHWLDVVHYGESDGYGMDRPRMNAWPYRDYLIQAFNEDKGYARFVQEQLAADALFPGEPALTPALGFVAAGPFNQSALVEQVDGTDCKKIALNLDRDDMVSSVAATFLSVTIHCARCHEHKFDPISQRDYYSMQSVFAGVVRGEREFDADPELLSERQHWQAVRGKLESREPLSKLAPPDRQRIARAMEPLKKKLLAQESAWKPLDASVMTGNAGTTVTRLDDGSFRFSGDLAETDVYTIAATTRMAKITALRLDVLEDEALPNGGPGRVAGNGNFVLTELKLTAAPADAPDKPTAIIIKQGMADWEQGALTAKAAFDGQGRTGWAIYPQQGQSHQAVFVFDKPATNPAGSTLTLRLEQLFGGYHLIGRLRLSITDSDVSKQKLVSPDHLAALKTADKGGNAALQSALGVLLVDEVLAAMPPLRKVWAVGSSLPKLRNYYPPKEPHPIRILARGDINHPGAEVKPGGLRCVSALRPEFTLADKKNEAARRAALAQWITAPQNMLAWRSIVNRIWHWHFGRGLVDSMNDFGRMGGAPSHPELLDWLACEFRDSGGSFKHLHRLILLSATYRQSVTATDTQRAAALDSDNKLLWRQNRRRLDAEQLRDSLLAVSGRLDLAMGGPSAMQFNYSDPNPNVVPRIDYEGFDPDAPGSLRRGIYRHLFRNINDSLLEAFDAVDPSLSTPRRNDTVTPLQSLSLYNSRFVLRQCEHLAARLEREAPALEARLDRGCLLLTGQPPDPVTKASLLAYSVKHGLANTCRVLLNSNDFLFVN